MLRGMERGGAPPPVQIPPTPSRVRAYACACVRMRAYACVRIMRACVRVRAYACVCALFAVKCTGARVILYR